jgi:hypothetical protein
VAAANAKLLASPLAKLLAVLQTRNVKTKTNNSNWNFPSAVSDGRRVFFINSYYGENNDSPI